eukprot:317685_1
MWLIWTSFLIYSALYSAEGSDACGSNAAAITDFQLTQYLGVWHQIAVNMDFYEVFERNYPLCVYANYSLNSNGTVSVVNTGFNAKGEMNQAIGVATQPKQGVAALEVSFYGSHPGPYWIIKMINDDEDKYSIALVWSCSGFGLIQDLWILSREYSISEQNYAAMINFAMQSGIDVARLRASA